MVFATSPTYQKIRVIQRDLIVLQVFKVGQYFRVHAAGCSRCGRVLLLQSLLPCLWWILLFLLLLHILAFFNIIFVKLAHCHVQTGMKIRSVQDDFILLGRLD